MLLITSSWLSAWDLIARNGYLSGVIMKLIGVLRKEAFFWIARPMMIVMTSRLMTTWVSGVFFWLAIE